MAGVIDRFGPNVARFNRWAPKPSCDGCRGDPSCFPAALSHMLTANQPKGQAMPTVRCPNCSAKLDAPSEDKGRAVKCKHCGHSFLLRFIGRSRTAIAGKLSDQARPSGESTVSFRLADSAEAPPSGPPERPATKRSRRQPNAPAESPAEPISVAAEPWRAAIYRQVTTERFDGDFSTFVRTALDALAEQLGYPVNPPR